MIRLAVALVLLASMGAVAPARVVACRCAWTELPEAVAEADVAFVGTLLGGSAQGNRAGPAQQPILTTWSVERSRDPLDTDRIEIATWPDDGANCGTAFGAGERWLLLAYKVENGREAGENGLETNGCMRNHRLDGGDPESEAIIEELLTVPVTASATPPNAGIDVPVPLLIGLGGLLAIGLASVLAFRRRPGDLS